MNSFQAFIPSLKCLFSFSFFASVTLQRLLYPSTPSSSLLLFRRTSTGDTFLAAIFRREAGVLAESQQELIYRCSIPQGCAEVVQEPGTKKQRAKARLKERWKRRAREDRERERWVVASPWRRWKSSWLRLWVAWPSGPTWSSCSLASLADGETM